MQAWKLPPNAIGRTRPIPMHWNLKKEQKELAEIYLKEQTEYIQNQIDKIRDFVDDRQSRIAWQTVNEMSRRKSTAKDKLKATSQHERIHLWKQHFENLLGYLPKVTHERITKILSKQLDMKLGPTRRTQLSTKKNWNQMKNSRSWWNSPEI